MRCVAEGMELPDTILLYQKGGLVAFVMGPRTDEDHTAAVHEATAALIRATGADAFSRIAPATYNGDDRDGDDLHVLKGPDHDVADRGAIAVRGAVGEWYLLGLFPFVWHENGNLCMERPQSYDGVDADSAEYAGLDKAVRGPSQPQSSEAIDKCLRDLEKLSVQATLTEVGVAMLFR